MADSSVSVLDSTGTTRAVDAQTVGTDYQQTVTIGDGVNAGRIAGIDATGHLLVRDSPATSATGTITSVAGSVSTVALLASNTARLGARIFNDSTAVLYVALAATASTTAYTFQLNPGAYYEQPANPLYTGAISGIWATATGNARITELT